MPETLSPSLAADLRQFHATYPDFDTSTQFSGMAPVLRGVASGQDPAAIRAFLSLRKRLDQEGFHFTKSGDPARDQPVWQQALMVAGVLAAPFAIGALPALGAGPGAAAGAGAGAGGGLGLGSILSTASTVAPLLTGLSSGRQAGREAETDATQRQDQIATQRAQEERLRAELALRAPSQRAEQSVLGDRLAKSTDARWTGETDMVGNIPVPRMSGGFTPSMYSDETRRLGGLLSQGAFADQEADKGKVLGPPPTQTPIAAGGRGDSILNSAATVSSLLSAIPYRRRPTTAPAPTRPVSNNVTWPTF